jgi:hypothetical protein
MFDSMSAGHIELEVIQTLTASDVDRSSQRVTHLRYASSVRTNRHTRHAQLGAGWGRCQQKERRR